MAEGQTEIQEKGKPKNNVINLEAAREKRLVRKIKGYKEPPKHIKIISAYFKQHPLPPLTQEELAKITEPLPPVDPSPNRLHKEQTGKTTSAKDAVTEQIHPHTKDKIIELQAVRQKLQSEQKERVGDRRNWHEIAKANDWGSNPDWPNDGFYVDRIVECAEKLGLDPRTLTPEERKELTTHGDIIIEPAKKLGLNTRTLTPQEREDLRYWGRIPTDEERKKKAEIAEKLGVKPLTDEKRQELFRNMLSRSRSRQQQMRPDLSPGEKVAEVIKNILTAIGKALKARVPTKPKHNELSKTG